MTYASATKTYTTTGAGLTSGVPGIRAKDPKNAKITFDGKSYEVAARSTHSLPYGTTEWEIIVQNSLNTETYKLILNNVDVLPSSGGGSSVSATPLTRLRIRSIALNSTGHSNSKAQLPPKADSEWGTAGHLSGGH